MTEDISRVPERTAEEPAKNAGEAPLASEKKRPERKDRPLPRLIVWGGSIGAAVLVALLVFVYILVLGDERPKEDLVSRTGAAISGEEAQLMPGTETGAELERIIANLEAGRLEQPAGEGGNTAAWEDPDGQSAQPGEQDPFLRPELARRMAYWMVDQYFPKGTHSLAAHGGILTTGISRANVQAVSLIGASGEDGGPPLYLKALDYVFTPDMLEELYLMHAGTFIEAMGRALDAARRKAPNAEPRSLSAGERAECVALYVNLLDQISRSLTAYMDLPEHSRRLNAWLSARERLLTAKARVADARAEYARLERAHEDTPEGRQLLQLTVRTEEQAALAEARTRENLLEALRAGNTVQDVDSGTLLYVACWAERRIAARRENSATIGAAAGILQRLGRAMQEAQLESTASARPQSAATAQAEQ